MGGGGLNNFSVLVLYEYLHFDRTTLLPWKGWKIEWNEYFDYMKNAPRILMLIKVYAIGAARKSLRGGAAFKNLS